MKRLGILSTAVFLAACAGGGDASNRTVWVPDGPSVNCISTHNIRSMRVIDDRTIDFQQNSRRIWRNELPQRCSGLTFGNAIRHNSRAGQLCSLNSITVVTPGPGPNGPTCNLGRFQPMKPAPQPEAPAAG
ncbi:DUF6491 family protein [Sandaracinobacteroides hominis]|uniref:DUF6491 family protein n=1 Tax=Sandaracinobacteroides hominis TaxID=2780086 RepID=UPI0018F76AF3|nr:DUF6491 family protein [Sandaracinobacteroides hominis]